jgi:predicted transcriptional regulator
MQDGEQTVAVTVRLSPETHRALQRLAQLEHRSLAGQVVHLLEQALAVEQEVRRVMAARRAQLWAQQARGLGRDAPGEPRAGERSGGEADEGDPEEGAPR